MSLNLWRNKIFGVSYYFSNAIMLGCCGKNTAMNLFRIIFLLLLLAPLIVRMCICGSLMALSDSLTQNWGMAFILTLMTSLGFGSITTLFTLVRKDYFNEFSQKVSDLYGTTALYGTTHLPNNASFMRNLKFMIFVILFLLSTSIFCVENYVYLEYWRPENFSLHNNFRKPMFGDKPISYIMIDITIIGYGAIFSILALTCYDCSYRALYDYLRKYNCEFEQASVNKNHEYASPLKEYMSKLPEFLELLRFNNNIWASFATNPYSSGFILLTFGGFIVRAYMVDDTFKILTRLSVLMIAILGFAILLVTMARPASVYGELRQTKNFLLLIEKNWTTKLEQSEISTTLQIIKDTDYALLLFNRFMVTEKIITFTFIVSVIIIEIMTACKRY